MPFERCYTVGLPNGTGPDVVERKLFLPDTGGPWILEAWLSNFGASNVHLYNGPATLVQMQDLLERGLLDFLMTVPAAGIGRRLLPDDANSIGVFFEANNSSGQLQAVTLRVYHV